MPWTPTARCGPGAPTTPARWATATGTITTSTSAPTAITTVVI